MLHSVSQMSPYVQAFAKRKQDPHWFFLIRDIEKEKWLCVTDIGNWLFSIQIQFIP